MLAVQQTSQRLRFDGGRAQQRQPFLGVDPVADRLAQQKEFVLGEGVVSEFFDVALSDFPQTGQPDSRLQLADDVEPSRTDPSEETEGVLGLEGVGQHEFSHSGRQSPDPGAISPAVEVEKPSESGGIVVHPPSRFAEFEDLGLVSHPGDVHRPAAARVSEGVEQERDPGDDQRRGTGAPGLLRDLAVDFAVEPVGNAHPFPAQDVDHAPVVVAFLDVGSSPSTSKLSEPWISGRLIWNLLSLRGVPEMRSLRSIAAVITDMPR